MAKSLKPVRPNYPYMLQKYYHIIFSEKWWIGPRDDLAKRMDKVWELLRKKEKEEALSFANLLYQQKINRKPKTT